MTPEEELERRQDIAMARLGVAEQLRWLVAIPFAGLIYVRYDSWLVAVAVFIVTFFVVTYWLDKEYEAARDAYERATGTGKYYAAHNELQRLEEELQRNEAERQKVIDQAAKEGKTISTEGVLRHVEELRMSYIAAGREDDAKVLDKIMAEFREKHGAEIPIAEAYRLQKEIERQTDGL